MTGALARLNFRDIGGLPAGEGRRVRSGLVFRSEGPASFDSRHRAELGEIGFRTICDLRSIVEREAAPNDWCGPRCLVLDLDMNTDLRAQGQDIWDSLRRDPGAANARRVMMENYRQMPAALAPHLPALVAAITEGATPLMIHCTAGKDRTGAVVALLLSLLGVDDDAIAADYLRSDVFADNMRIAGSIEHGFQKTFGFVPDAEVVQMMIGVDVGFLSAALDEVRHRWGGIADYFEAADVGRSPRLSLIEILIERTREEERA